MKFVQESLMVLCGQHHGCMNSYQTQKYHTTETDTLWREKGGGGEPGEKAVASFLICWFVIWTRLISSASEITIPDCQKTGVIHIAYPTAVYAEVLAVRSACCWVMGTGCCIEWNLSFTLSWVFVAHTTSVQYNFLHALQNTRYLISDPNLG